jgi:hypothetical protein
MSCLSVPGAKHIVKFESKSGPQSNFPHQPISFGAQTDHCYKTACDSKGWLYVELTVQGKMRELVLERDNPVLDGVLHQIGIAFQLQ